MHLFSTLHPTFAGITYIASHKRMMRHLTLCYQCFVEFYAHETDIVILCFHGISGALFSQKGNDKLVKKARESYDAAMIMLRDGYTKDAIPLLQKAIENDPLFMDAYLSLAGVNGELKQYAKAVSYYEKARDVRQRLF